MDPATQGSDGKAKSDLFNKPAPATGLSPGSYPGVLAAWRGPEKMKDSFDPAGGTRDVIFAVFAVKEKDGTVSRAEILLNAEGLVKQGGIHRQSNLFKILVQLAPDLVEKGAPLSAYIGSTAVVIVENTKKGFPVARALAPKLAGLEYPSAGDLPRGEDDSIPF